MNSTESERRQAIGRFVDGLMRPLAERLNQSETAFFPTGPEAGLGSYLIPRRVALGQMDMEGFGASGSDEILDSLETLWMQNGNVELLSLLPQLRELNRLFDEHPELSTEIAPFIYAMY